MQTRSRLGLGISLVLWKPVWDLLGHWSTAEFIVQKLKERAVLDFLLGPVGGNLMIIAGGVLIYLAFDGVEQQMTRLQIASPPLSPISAEIEIQQEGARLRCTSVGLSGIYRTVSVWKPNGSTLAAVATLKNTQEYNLRNVTAFAQFYDSDGRKVAFDQLLWLDERHDNTGFPANQERTLVIAVRTRGREYFRTPDLMLFAARKIRAPTVSVSVKLYADGPPLPTLVFALQIKPQPSFRLVRVWP
jgi:hypothetical protein